jgi:hypothetical protein
MNLRWENRTLKNLETIYLDRNKVCNSCRDPLIDRTPLMMGVAYECIKCDKKWRRHGQDLARIL